MYLCVQVMYICVCVGMCDVCVCAHVWLGTCTSMEMCMHIFEWLCVGILVYMFLCCVFV